MKLNLAFSSPARFTNRRRIPVAFSGPGDPEDGRREHEMRVLMRRIVENGAYGDHPELPHAVLRLRLAMVHHCRRAGSDHQEEGMLA